MKRIGIIGGTFDPIHNGHLLLGKQAYDQYQLDQIWYMPAKQPPHKSKQHVTDAICRCHMIELAIAPYSYMKLSEFELLREETSYTAKTVMLLKEQFPEQQFYFIIGADSLFEMERWYRPEVIFNSVPLLVADRTYPAGTLDLKTKAAALAECYQADIRLLDNPLEDISSHQIRADFAAGRNCNTDLPRSVKNYILEHNLYREEGAL